MGGGWNQGLSSARSKLTYKQVQEIRELSTEKLTIADIARRYGVSRRTIRDVRDRKLYLWVPNRGELDPERADALLDSQTQVW